MHERDVIGRALLLILLSIAAVAGARVAVSGEDAKALGTTLTPVGAEQAGSADGRIPAYAGEKPITSTAQSNWEFPVFDPKRTQPIRPDEPYFQ
jgi:hypothetical protein